jgi:hypothetical protein
VADPKVEAVVIASPQEFHREIAIADSNLRPEAGVLREAAGRIAGGRRRWWPRPRRRAAVNMVGFNYVRTPATQFVPPN